MNHTSRYPAPDINDLPDDIKAKVLEVQAKAGFVPNVFLALARRPAEWRAFFAYHDALMLKEASGLTKGDREMIVTATSAAINSNASPVFPMAFDHPPNSSDGPYSARR